MQRLSPEAIAWIRRVLDEAAKAVNDKTRTTGLPRMPEVIGATAGAVIGLGVGLGALSIASSEVAGVAAVGAAVASGGVAASVAVIALPVVALAGAGYFFANRFFETRKREQEEAMLQDAIRKQDAVFQELQIANAANVERIAYLQELLGLLKIVIDSLRTDLGVALSA